MTTLRQVLVIDGPSETAAVLKAVLEPRGAVVQRTRAHAMRHVANDQATPDVVIVDGDDCDGELPAWNATPQVVIASECIQVDEQQARFLQKPFQYPELIRVIEDLLAATPPAMTDANR